MNTLTLTLSLILLILIVYLYLQKTSKKEHYLDPRVPDNQLCSKLIQKVFGRYKFSEKARNVIGSLKPDITTMYGAVGIVPKINTQCVLPNYGDSDLSSDLHTFKVSIQSKFDGNMECLSAKTDDSLKVELPYRNAQTAFRGCEVNIMNYKNNPKAFEKILEDMHDISREEYQKIHDKKINEMNDILASNELLENENNILLKTATDLTELTNLVNQYSNNVQEQINNIQKINDAKRDEVLKLRFSKNIL